MARGKGRKDDKSIAALVTALNHPSRREILRLLLDCDELSPRAASGIMDKPLPHVSYHVRVLARTGAVTLSGTRQRRGAIEHFYTATEEVKEAGWIRRALPPGTAA